MRVQEKITVGFVMLTFSCANNVSIDDAKTKATQKLGDLYQCETSFSVLSTDSSGANGWDFHLSCGACEATVFVELNGALDVSGAGSACIFK